jgi:4-amino-4-deoxy-L-arabinose transferase-like glycosyltransferase
MLASLWLYVPTYRPADEASHVAYARELSHGRLPTIDTTIAADGDPRLAQVLGRRDTRHRTIWTTNHPPLYYVLVAVPLRLGAATGHPVAGVQAARLLSVGLSALGLVALAYVVMQLVPGRPQLAVAAGGLVALLPSLVSISARVYNDSLAFLATTVALAAVVVFVARGPSAVRLAAVAASASVAALTRASGLLVVGVAGLAVLVGVWRASPGGVLRRLWRGVVWAGVVAVAVAVAAGWFYLRNRRLYGDLSGSVTLLERFDRSPAGTVMGLLTDPGFWRTQQERLWRLEPDAVHPGPVGRRLWLLGLVPLAGLLLAGGRWLARLVGGGRRPDRGPLVALGLCVLLLGLLQLSVVQLVSNGT